MNNDEALRALEDVEVVPCLSAPIAEAKEMLAVCLEEEIPAVLDRAPCCEKGSCGCAPKFELLVQPDDVPRVGELLRKRWNGMLDREGTAPAWVAGAEPEAEPPCPACGHVGPLNEGACTGCGLHLG